MVASGVISFGVIMYVHINLIIIHTRSLTYNIQNPGGPAGTGPEFDNCMVLDNTLQLSWRVDNSNSQVRFQLCGCTATDAR